LCTILIMKITDPCYHNIIQLTSYCGHSDNVVMKVVTNVIYDQALYRLNNTKICSV
jgi:hypothetical protein